MLVPRPAIVAALHVDEVGERHFRAPARQARQHRIFGGQVMAQALLAATHTVAPELGVHLLHARFLRPGDPAHPVDYVVDPAGDRGAFAHRRVVGRQGDVTVLELSASFHRGETGPGHQYPAGTAGDPEAVPSFKDLALTGGDDSTKRWWARLSQWLPVDVRAAAVPGRWLPGAGEEFVPRQDIWLRSHDTMDDDRAQHAAAAAYCSDLFLLTAAMVRHGLRHDDPGVLAVTLNHTMWFHAPFRADQWWRYQQEGSWSGSGRVLCSGRMFDRSGKLVATTMQEGLLRVDEPSVRLGEQRLAG